MARPTKYNEITARKICDAIRLGATYELAAAYAGINYDTFNEWRKKYSAFSESIKKSEGLGAIGWLAKIEQAAKDGDWRAAAWKLERRHPKAFGKHITYEEIAPEKIPDLTDEELDELAAKLIAAGRS